MNSTLWRMGLDDFQLFDERRKRKPLGDVTNQNSTAGANRGFKSKPEAFGTRLLSLKRSSTSAFGIIRHDIKQKKQQAVSLKTSSVPEINRKLLQSTPIRNSISLESGSRENNLLLNLKRVLADSSFTRERQSESSYFEFVHGLSHFNDVTEKSNDFIKGFANRQRLHQLRSTQAHTTPLDKVDNCKNSKPSLSIKVTQVSHISEFIVAISSHELSDCLLLNTIGLEVTSGLNLFLDEFKIYNLKGKDVSLYTKWRVQR